MFEAEEDYWLKDEDVENIKEEEEKALIESLETEEAGIIEVSMCKNSREAAHNIAGAIVRTLQMKAGSDSCSWLLINRDSSASQTIFLSAKSFTWRLDESVRRNFRVFLNNFYAN